MELLHRTLDYLVQGGWLMVPLVVCSLAMWTLITERLYFFRNLTLRDIRIQEAIGCVRSGTQPSSVAGLRARVVLSFLARRTGRPDLDRNILQHCALLQRPLFHRYLAAIAVLASVAPLLGLLGTVVGMVHTFDVIAVFGTGNVQGLSNGISVALVTTQSGLLVAIPGLFLGGFLYRRAARQEMRLEEITSILMRHV